MKKIYVLLLLALVACKKEVDVDDPCSSPVLGLHTINADEYFSAVAQIPLGTSSITKFQANEFCRVTHQLIPTGGVNVDSANKYYYATIPQLFGFFQIDDGGPACGGIAMVSYRILDSLTTAHVATLSIRVKDMANPTTEGHVITLMEIVQDDSLIYPPVDFMFGKHPEWVNSPGKWVDIRDMIRLAYEGTLSEQVMLVSNAVPSFYFQETHCRWDNTTAYAPDNVEGIYDSGREQYKYFIYADRTLERYSQYFSWNGKTFAQTYNEICMSYGWGPFDFEEHPEDLVYIYAAVFGFIIADDGFPVEKFNMFGVYQQSQVPIPPRTFVSYVPGKF